MELLFANVAIKKFLGVKVHGTIYPITVMIVGILKIIEDINKMLQITKSDKRSGWRAFYVFNDNRKLGYLGIDIKDKYNMLGPNMFGGIGNKVFKFSLPYLKFKTNSGKLYSMVYQYQNKMWYSFVGKGK